ncbi:NACHT domain-containing protein [Streptomyces sp. AC627_RSS907]|uniref:NACHT domain-containing protein n=1 Tax=Streptomyces sp. AC627_RSS907 TaxID=2823684 RepID=UPI001C211752|nr:NACHT domain-containing protein [Streptomyces sp. AC627_RSS907]
MHRKLLFQIFLVCGYAGAFWYLWNHGLEETGWLAGVIAALLLPFVIYLPSLVIRQQGSSATQVSEALDALSHSVAEAPQLWMEQLGLHIQELAAVPWGRPPGTVLVDANVRASGSGLRGNSRDIDTLVGDFLALKPPRLVITGEAGSGKSCLAIRIAQAIVERRRDPAHADLPLPVIFPLAEWSPKAWDGWHWKWRPHRGRNSLERWMVSLIHQQCPDLRGFARFGPNAAELLIRNGKILPVFDGLDEIPQPARVAALSALKDQFDDGLPFILSVRRKEYERAVKAVSRSERITEGVIRRAELIQAEKLSPVEAAGWLAPPSSSTEWQAAWRPVQRMIVSDPSHPVTEAVNTPLMLFLARSAYRKGGDPGELLNSSRFPDRKTVRNHLLDAYIPALLGDRSTDSRSTRRRQDAAGRTVRTMRATRLQRHLEWLAYLHSGSHRSYALASANIAKGSAITRRLPFHAVMLVSALALVPWLEVMYHLWYAATLSEGSGQAPGDAGRQLLEKSDSELDNIAAALQSVNFSLNIPLCVVLGAVAAELVIAIGMRMMEWRGPSHDRETISIWMVSPLLGMILLVALEPFLREAGHIPAWLLDSKDDRLDSATGGVGALMTSLLCCLGIAAGGGRMHFAPRGHRRVRLARGWLVLPFGCLAVVAAVTLWRSADPPLDHVPGWPVGPLLTALAAISGAAISSLGSGWVFLRAAHAEAVLRGRLPLRLFSFMEDMHRLGVLRLTGSTYQFRHAELQDRLAELGRDRWA